MTRLAALALLLAAPAAHAYEGTIVFTRFGSVYQQAADPTAVAVEIAELPDDATEVRWAEAIEDGRLVVFDLGTYPVWVYAPDPSRPALLRGGPCAGRARPSPGGGCVVCPTRDGTLLVAAGRTDQAPLAGPLAEASFLGPSGLQMGALTEEGVVAFDRRRPGDRRIVARPGARSHILFSPDGTRAVAVFGSGDSARVRSFVLDGEGVSRQLGGPGVPTSWSWDSQWILFQEGDIKDLPDEEEDDGAGSASAFLLQAPQRRRPQRRRRPPARASESAPAGPLVRACVARAVGGEVKCWERYTAMSFSPDSTLVLLKRGTSLYVGKIAGVRPETPVKLLDNVDGAATWVPRPIAAPLPP